MEKTNVMRILDQKKIEYKSHSYADTDAISGKEVAEALNENPDRVFKTLVTQGNSKNYYVFMIPVLMELDLKKAAKAVGEKSIEMIHVKELKDLTGYIRGGCTSIGMKKQFKTVVHESALNFEKIIISAGCIGAQIILAPKDLQKVTRAEFKDIVME